MSPLVAKLRMLQVDMKANAQYAFDICKESRIAVKLVCDTTIGQPRTYFR
jgi:hypothetical protein